MGISGCYLGIPVTEHILNQPQVLGFVVKIGAATVPEDVAGAARVLQVTGIQSLVHDGAEAVPGDTTQQVPVGRGKYQWREYAVLLNLTVSRDGLQIFLQNGKGFVTRIDRLQSALVSLATNHDCLGIPVDIFYTGTVNLNVSQPLNSHQIQDELVPVSGEGNRIFIEDMENLVHLLGCVEVQQGIVVATGSRCLNLGSRIDSDKSQLSGSGIECSDSYQHDLDAVRLVLPVQQELPIHEQLVLIHVQRVPLIGQAPAEEEVNLVAVVPHGVGRRIALGNDPLDELGVMGDEILLGDLLDVQSLG